MKKEELLKPPRYAPNAVLTARGWEDPNTGELLVSNRFLIALKQAQERTVVKTPEPDEPAETDDSDEPDDSETTDEKKPKKRGRKPKPKTDE